jgi:hypothetical protein
MLDRWTRLTLLVSLAIAAPAAPAAADEGGTTNSPTNVTPPPDPVPPLNPTPPPTPPTPPDIVPPPTSTPTTPAPPNIGGIELHMFAQSSYWLNLNLPKPRFNRFRVFDYNANSFTLDVFQLSLVKPATKPNEWGGTVDLAFGYSLPTVLEVPSLPATIPSTTAVGRFDQALKQAFITFVANTGNGLILDVGKFMTPVGHEVIEDWRGINNNVSHSFMFGFGTPLTQTGVRATYPFSDTFTGMAMITNGWNDAVDNNSLKSLGLGGTLKVTPDVTLRVADEIGPERLDSKDLRNLFDVSLDVTSGSLEIGANADFGLEQGPDLVDPTKKKSYLWAGLAAYLKATLSDSMYFAGRAEVFDDKGGSRLGVLDSSGNGITLGEVTATLGFQLAKGVWFVPEARIDLDLASSSGGADKVFFGSDSSTSMGAVPTKSFQPTVGAAIRMTLP